jgi:hypothetical protein
LNLKAAAVFIAEDHIFQRPAPNKYQMLDETLVCNSQAF